jgi:hypothetical protein
MEGQIKLPLLKAQIRSYNSMFVMTSMYRNVDKKINDGRGPYIFRLNGQITKELEHYSHIMVENPVLHNYISMTLKMKFQIE